MRVSEAWLREWVNPPCDIKQLTHAMTMAGLKIDGAVPIAPPPAGVVAGKIVSIVQHPNADRLRVCQVDVGGETLQIVCGAPNARAGMIAPLAKVGAKLPGGLEIKPAELRGVASRGMLCSAKELGLSDDASGLLELDASVSAGAALTALVPATDHELDVDLTPNRGDCMSVRGLTRELGAIFDLPVSVPVIAPVAITTGEKFSVRVDAPQGCPRYLGRVIKGVDRRAPTPLWMRERLRKSGMRSIDAVVDVTNYIMLEFGQPLHAFDLERLSGGIVVRLALPKETIRLLDGKDLELRDDTLVITDANGPVAMAGIMGGERSGIQEEKDRCDVFLECALFAPSAIRGRPRAYGLHTESSQRYERGVDSAIQEEAMERATALLLALCGGEAGVVVDADHRNTLTPKADIRLRSARLTRLLGVEIPRAEVEGCLKRLDLSVLKSDTEGWLIRVPSHRYDLEREEDLVEEVSRIYGFDRLPNVLPPAATELTHSDGGQQRMAALRRTLTAAGFQEAITYSFIDAESQRLLQPNSHALMLDNPLSAEMAVMRTSLVPGLLRALQYNLNRQQARVRLFETGRCFLADAGHVEQPMRLAAVMCGGRRPESWAHVGAEKGDSDFFDMKGVLEQLIGDEDLEFERVDDSRLHPGQSAALIRAGRSLGVVGRLHPTLSKQLDLSTPVHFFELDVEPLLPESRTRYQPFSAFPAVRRDLALLIARDVAYHDLARCVRELLGEQLVELRLFDLYMGEGIDSTKKSLALGLTLQDRSRTLTDADVQGLVGKAVTELERRFGAVQR